MSLDVGSQIAHYSVTALIGEGGVGQVYEATDSKLNRQVALKIQPEAFASDPDRIARFERKAQVLASLNHPGIAQGPVPVGLFCVEEGTLMAISVEAASTSGFRPAVRLFQLPSTLPHPQSPTYEVAPDGAIATLRRDGEDVAAGLYRANASSTDRACDVADPRRCGLMTALRAQFLS